jgi:hypothetical protein
LVDLSKTKINDAGLQKIRFLTAARSLNLGECFAVGDLGLAAVADLKELRTLRLFGCHKITDDGFEHLRELTKLTDLHIGYTGVGTTTGSGLSHL